MDLLKEARTNLPNRVETNGKIGDGHGAVAWVVEISNEEYEVDETCILAAKDYAYKHNASFMQAVVERADRYGAPLIFYSSEKGSYTVFNPEFYLERGIASTGDSRKGRDVKWLERPLDDGAPMYQYLMGEKVPKTICRTNEHISQY